MKYSKFQIDEVKSKADIRKSIPSADVTKPTSYVTCPECGKSGKGKGLCITHKKGMNIAKCFSCGFSLSDALAATMYYDFGNDKSKFPEAVKRTAEANNIFISPEEDTPPTKPQPRRQKNKSFCQKQLEASGLTESDVMVKSYYMSNGERIESFVPAMRKGGIDAAGNVRESDDEMLIYYYRLDGTLEQYATRGARGALRPYIRVRWSNPDLHTPEGGREMKYQTPKGAPTKFYFPQRLRNLYEAATPIETLIIQEGEKKAEKACKHGIPSIAIQGIYNIGNKESGLPQDLQYIIQRCGVKNVVLLMDADWDRLSRRIEPDGTVDYRPRMFAGAAIKFKRYVNSLHNLGINVDIYFGHINENEAGDKGIDDLLCNTLRGIEDELRKDIDVALHSHDGLGRYCSIHCITTLSNLQIQDFWDLGSHEKFFAKHAERLKEIKSFRFNRFLWQVNDQGDFELASKVASNIVFWRSTTNENSGKVSIEMDTYEALRFINSAGFYRMHTADLDEGDYKFVKIEDGIVYQSSAVEIRDFVWAYILQSSKDTNIRNHFAARLSNYLSSDKLERLDTIDDNFDVFEPNKQDFFFRNGMLTATSQGLEWSPAILRSVWSDKIIKHKFRRVPIIAEVGYDENEGFIISPTSEGLKCEFFKFLQCVSNFWWEKSEPSPQVEKEFRQHVINKITAIGYLLTDYKFQTELKAVIAMDGELSDVGQSNGRTGKSLIGKALSYMTEQTPIDGRNTKNDDDFIYSLVTLRTRNIFMDDVNVNFNFERFYFAITGDLSVNPKGGSRFVIPADKSPKFYITTNHAINGASTRSSQERIIYMGFSNYFNDTRHPIDVFGHQFFADWDEEQWNLFYNFMAECVWIYLKSRENGWARPGQGAVAPPLHDIMQRTLRQQMSESIYQWAEVYFDPSGCKLNFKQQRGEMFADLKSHYPDAKSGITQANFKTKVIYYCQFKGYHFNPNKLNKEGRSFKSWIVDHRGESFIGEADKSGGVEYFSIYDTDHALKEII